MGWSDYENGRYTIVVVMQSLIGITTKVDWITTGLKMCIVA